LEVIDDIPAELEDRLDRLLLSPRSAAMHHEPRKPDRRDQHENEERPQAIAKPAARSVPTGRKQSAA
jgi:hypothetical protein